MHVVVYGTALILALMALYLGLVWLRRRFRRSSGGPAGPGFTIDELEAMRASGQLSDGEFRRLRSLALGLSAGARGQKESELSNPPGTDDEK